MKKLEETIQTVLRQQRNQLSESTFIARRCYFYQLLGTASTMGIDEPCQKLYDTFVTDDYDSNDRRFHLNHCVKLIDECAGTNALKKDGTLYNEPSLPTKEATYMQLKDICYPVKAIDIGFLIIKSEQEMEYLNLSASTTGQYKHSWKDIYRYFILHGSRIYCKISIEKYIDELNSLRELGHIKEWKWKINRKAAHILIEVAATGHYQWRQICRTHNCLESSLENIRNKYLSSLKARNLKESTIQLHDYVIRYALNSSGILSAEDLKICSLEQVQDIIKYFSTICNRRSLATIFPVLRSILDYFHENGFTETRLSGMVMGAFMQKGNVAGYISADDEEKLLKQLSHESKRTKAIILIALRLGLRDSDICNLTFQAIDWNNDKLRILQKKTGEPLVLPLLPDVGNALMDYIINDRPSRTDLYPYVFLRKQAPHNKLSSVYASCSKLIKRMGIYPINGTSTGVHLYRYTLVHRLLEAKVPHQVITDTLGHKSKESDKPYLSMDESMLRMCALDLSIIGVKSWKEGGYND
jgi:integrase